MVTRRLASEVSALSAALAVALLGAALLAGCKPNLDDSVSIVSTPSVLVVRSELLAAGGAGAPGTPAVPSATTEAEAKVTEQVRLTALYVSASGAVTESSLDWAFCDERKPLAELGPVSPLCLQTTGDGFTALGTGNEVTGVIPENACEQFGSDSPQPQKGQPPGRPVDPDSTGGYYQPIRVLDPSGGLVTIAGTRLECTLASFSPDLVAQYQQRYHRNTNPRVDSLRVVGAASPWSSASDPNPSPNVVSAGEHLMLEVSWPDCPATDAAGDGVCGPDETGTICGTCDPGVSVSRDDCCVDTDCKHAQGCAGAERYVVLNAASSALIDQREAMAVAWFATAGSFDFDRSGRSRDDLAASSDNGWRAPAAAGPVTLWVVLRDERGGVGWQQYALDVR
jgi:hypothetical protein